MRWRRGEFKEPANEIENILEMEIRLFAHLINGVSSHSSATRLVTPISSSSDSSHLYGEGGRGDRQSDTRLRGGGGGEAVTVEAGKKTR